MLEARLLIETHCARRVAAHGAGIAGALRQSIIAQEDAARDGGAGFTHADRECHRTIVAANGNDLLTRQYDSVRDRQQRITSAAIARHPARIDQFIAEHREIAAAIERGDGDAVADLIRAHLTVAYTLALRRPS